MPKPAGALRSADAIAAAAVLLLGGALALIGWGFARRWQSTGTHRIIGAEEILGLAAASAGTGLVAWWFLAVAGACAGTVLDRHGRTRAAAVSRKISPAFIQRLAVAALSAQLLTGPAAHAGVATGPEWLPTQEQPFSPPTSPGAATGISLNAAAGANEGPPPRSMLDPGWRPAAPAPDPGMLAAPGARAETVRNSARDPLLSAVTVLAGDTLWDIAAQHLGPGASDVEIALQWPRWYEANRALIGQSPDVLLPGQILQPPSPA